MDLQIRNNREASRYETTVDGSLAYTEYELEDEVVVFTHTIVPEEIGGRGVANALIRYALDDVRQSGRKVKPQCAFVDAFMRRHADYDALRA